MMGVYVCDDAQIWLQIPVYVYHYAIPIMQSF